MKLKSLSLERLFHDACMYRLVKDYRIWANSVQISLDDAGGDRWLEFDPEEARIFLGGLVLGYLQSNR